MAQSPHQVAEEPQYGNGVPKLLLIEAAGGDRPIRGVLDAAREILHVEHVTSVREGVDCLKRHSYGAVLLDLTLPERPGAGGVDELTRWPRTSRS